MLEVRKSNIHGRGVFCDTFISKGTELICDVILIDKTLENNYKDIKIIIQYALDLHHFLIMLKTPMLKFLK